MLRSMQGYAVIATGVRLAVSCSSSKASGGVRSNVLNTQGTGKLGDNVSSVFGSKFLGTLTPVSVEYREGAEAGACAGVPITVKGEGETADAPSDTDPASATIAGYVSKCGLGVGRSDSDRQFWYINGRPVDLPRFTKVLDDEPPLLHQHTNTNTHQHTPRAH
jgi:DNA mismatch repair protein PMS2